MQSCVRYVRNASFKFRLFSGGRANVTGTDGAPPPAFVSSGSFLGKSAPVTPPEQMNSFRSVFEPLSTPGHPAAHLERRRYKLRWDWHLRNFLVSMIPPTALAIFALVYNSVHEEELKQLQAVRDAEKKRIAEEKDAKVESLSARIFGDLHSLQAEIEAMRSEMALMRERDREKRIEGKNLQSLGENAIARGKGEADAVSVNTGTAKQDTAPGDPDKTALLKDPKK